MKRVIWLCVALLFVGAGLVLARISWQWLHPDGINTAVPSRPFRVAREVFPFSVVPGGVYDPAELSESIQHDPVARQHYKSIDPARMWNSRLRTPMLAYVSFRKGDSIRWTKNKVLLPKGELVLTDGSNLVRARCGNRIALKIPEPLAEAPAEAPPEFVFETPIPALVPPTVMAPPPMDIAIAARPAEPKAWATPVWSGAELQPTNITSVPEPGTLLLFTSGATVMFAAVRRRRRK